MFADTILYFALMAATIFLWTCYVSDYLQENSRFIKVLYYTGWIFLASISLVLIMNLFVPVMFWFDENGVYHSANLRYAILIIQVIMFMSSACYVLLISEGKNDSSKRRHRAIGMFGLAMAVLVIIQVTYPLLPLYAAGWLLGTCILHTFVLEDMKEENRLELEKMIQRDEEQKQQLGSARKLAYKDTLTGVKNYNAYFEAEQDINERIENGELKEFGVLVFDVNGLKTMNDTYGHEAGDRLLQDACRMICKTFKHSPVFRIGGDEFVALLEGQDYENRESLLHDFDSQVEMNLQNGTTVVASGLDTFRSSEDKTYRQVFERADARMYERKSILKAQQI